MFRSQRGPDPFVGEGRLESLLHGPFRRFVLSLSLSSPLCLLWFVFIYRRTRKSGSQWSRTRYAGFESLFVPPSWSLHPCLVLSSLPPVERRETRESSLDGGREADERWKIDVASSPLFCEIVFLAHRYTEMRCLSFNELASSDLFAPLPISPLS